MNNKYYTVCGIVEIDGKVLLVRHTYGNARNRILLPGGYVHENELPTTAAEREILEETPYNSSPNNGAWCSLWNIYQVRQGLTVLKTMRYCCLM